ncbi:hypothetical protein PIB30_089811 [Stylosanthes scabra]|uniref:Uncharacterized protein n=1 Tax=Stylosanthes scabra TaxID=79078 RepID=A0ABU6QUR6_9FABA|nr:hypothetical protein [Stylosanthes scabra]
MFGPSLKLSPNVTLKKASKENQAPMGKHRSHLDHVFDMARHGPNVTSTKAWEAHKLPKLSSHSSKVTFGPSSRLGPNVTHLLKAQDL